LLFYGPAKEPLTIEMLIGFLTSLTLVYLVVFSAYHALQQANERIEGLLLNILPSSIAARLAGETRQKLRQEGAGIADEYSEATILFADIVGFTELAAKTTTAELMTILDAVFTEFDHLAEKHQVEKIKTIGDAYMAVCGLPEPNPDHARNVAAMALAMLDAVGRYREESSLAIRLRIGINTGPVIAGIIGRKKFIYDLWGDAVNVASRMESHGEPDTVQVSAGTQEALKDTYDFEPLGPIEIKGKGQLPAWRLVGPKAT
jgi:class 3 adenylate cyclase